MNKEPIKQVLLKELASVYCGTCEAQEDWCDECHREMMNWGISENAADELADKIMAKVDSVLKAEHEAMYKALKRVIKHHDKMYNMRDAIFGAKIAISLVDGRE